MTYMIYTHTQAQFTFHMYRNMQGQILIDIMKNNCTDATACETRLFK